MTTPRYYVYQLCTPDGTPFYVGKGQRGRMFAHVRESQTSCTCAKCVVIRSVEAAGSRIRFDVIHRTDDEAEAYAVERARILELGFDVLTNKPFDKRAPGGGRKPLDGQGTQRVTVTLRPSDLAYLRSLDANVSAALRMLIDTER